MTDFTMSLKSTGLRVYINSDSAAASEFAQFIGLPRGCASVAIEETRAADVFEASKSRGLSMDLTVEGGTYSILPAIYRGVFRGRKLEADFNQVIEERM